MPPDHPLARISMTIQADVLRRSDRVAKREGRSRSWVLTDAVRLAEPPPSSQPPLDESRRGLLLADLALSPTERALAAERTAREVPVRRFAKEWAAAEVARKFVTIIGDSPRVDILTLAWSVRYRDAIRTAEHFEVEGVVIPSVSLDDLVASKPTGRPQDLADLVVLEEIRRSH